MERLTNNIDYCQLHCDFGKEKDCLFTDKSKCYENNMYNKLREYEIAEEQELLLKLPVAIGSEVWKIVNQRDNFTDIPYKIITIVHFRLDMLKEIGKTVFLTKEEAEQALAEMKENDL